MDDIEVMAVLIACIIHDVDHPVCLRHPKKKEYLLMLNNIVFLDINCTYLIKKKKRYSRGAQTSLFMVNTESDYALLYNDKSVRGNNSF